MVFLGATDRNVRLWILGEQTMKIKNIIFGLLAILLLSSFTFSYDVTDDLSWWSFQTSLVEGLEDKTTNGYDLTNSGVTYDGTNDLFNFDNSDYLTNTGIDPDIYNTGFTANIWFNADSLTSSPVLIRFPETGSWGGIFMQIDPVGTMTARWGCGVSTCNHASINVGGISTGVDYMATITHDGTNDKIYINGVLKDIFSSGTLTNNDDTLYIGSFDGTQNFFDGSIYGGSISETAKDAIQIGDLYSNGKYFNAYADLNTLKISSQIYNDYKLLNFNATINGTNYQTTNGTIITTLNSTELVPVTIQTKYFNISSFNIEATGDFYFNYSVLEVDAKNKRNNNTISAFNLTLNDFNETISSNASKVILYLNESQNSPLNVSVSAPTIATTNASLNFTGTNISTSTIYVYEANSIQINIYDTSTGNLTNATVTVQFNLNGNLTSNTTSTGSLFVYDFEEGNYSITFTADGFTTVSYDALVTNFSTQTLNAYITPTTTGQSTIFAFKNIENEAIIEGVTLSVERIISDVWTLINVLSSDVSGRAQFDYETGVKYRFTASKSGWETREFTLNPVIFTSYNIWLTQEIEEIQEQDFSGVNILAYPGTYYNGQNNTVELIFTSPDGRLQSYGFTATYNNISVTKSGSNLYGGSLTDLLLIENATFGDQVNLYYYYRLSNGTLKEFNSPYVIADTATPATQWNNKNNHYGLGLAERVLIVIGIVILVSGTAFMFGGAVAGGIVAMLIFGYFLFIGFVSGWIVIPSMIAIFIFTAWGATK